MYSTQATVTTTTSSKLHPPPTLQTLQVVQLKRAKVISNDAGATGTNLNNHQGVCCWKQTTNPFRTSHHQNFRTSDPLEHHTIGPSNLLESKGSKV